MADAADRIDFPATVLIVAMDAEQIVAERGAQTVHLANSNAMAMKIGDESPIDFALLDYNLGASTSEAAAKWLRERDVPFIFTTGYGEHEGITQTFSGTPAIKKPYEKADVLAAIIDGTANRR